MSAYRHLHHIHKLTKHGTNICMLTSDICPAQGSNLQPTAQRPYVHCATGLK